MDEDVQWEYLKDAIYPESIEGIKKIYKKWAPTYEKDMIECQDVSNQTMVNASFSFIKNTDSSLMLDIGTGPGTAARCYKEAGFKGQMDGIDLAQEMLDIARSKGIYRNLFLHTITEHEPLPVDDGTYDVVIASGSLIVNHIQPRCISRFVDALKPGGLLIYNSRISKGNQEYLDMLTECGEELEREKKVQLLNKEQIPYDDISTDAFLFMYKKL